jgi:hypothetical protein
MKPNPQFTQQSHEFWSCVKLISQKIGYAKKGNVLIPTPMEVSIVFNELELSSDLIITNGQLTEFGILLFEYFKFRADLLNNEVQHNLMDVDNAKALFEQLQQQHKPKCPLPMNKQSGEKKAIAFFTAIINTLIEASVNGISTVYDPRQITAFTKNNFPARSLSRRVDGSFPDEINPIAIWEIKEYYYTTTFGSRIADGVYETMLDGYELADARKIIERPIFHYLMIDSHRTWWKMGISYLCRIVDMLHMGLITECLVGKEVVTRIPEIVAEWLDIYEKHKDEYKGKSPELTLTAS